MRCYIENKLALRTKIPPLWMATIRIDPLVANDIQFKWNTSGGSAVLSWRAFILATLIILTGIALILRDVRRENRERVIAIEARGLRDWKGEPQDKAAPIGMRGRREPIIIDIRQGVIDGQIVETDAALRRISYLPADIDRGRAASTAPTSRSSLAGLRPSRSYFCSASSSTTSTGC